jgi:hypothetical protein
LLVLPPDDEPPDDEPPDGPLGFGVEALELAGFASLDFSDVEALDLSAFEPPSPELVEAPLDSPPFDPSLLESLLDSPDFASLDPDLRWAFLP